MLFIHAIASLLWQANVPRMEEVWNGLQCLLDGVARAVHDGRLEREREGKRERGRGWILKHVWCIHEHTTMMACMYSGGMYGTIIKMVHYPHDFCNTQKVNLIHIHPGRLWLSFNVHWQTGYKAIQKALYISPILNCHIHVHRQTQQEIPLDREASKWASFTSSLKYTSCLKFITGWSNASKHSVSPTYPANKVCDPQKSFFCSLRSLYMDTSTVP